MLRFMGSQRVGNVCETELNWTEWGWMPWSCFVLFCFSVLSQLFHSPPSPSSRGSLVLLCFLRKRQLEFDTYLNFKGLYLSHELLRSALLLKLYSSITLLSSKKLKIKKNPLFKNILVRCYSSKWETCFREEPEFHGWPSKVLPWQYF